MYTYVYMFIGAYNDVYTWCTAHYLYKLDNRNNNSNNDNLSRFTPDGCARALIPIRYGELVVQSRLHACDTWALTCALQPRPNWKQVEQTGRIERL